MLLYSIVIIGTINIKSELVTKVYFVAQGIMVAFIVILSQMGLVEDFIVKTSDRTRHFLGFDYTTTPAILFLFMIMSYIFFKKGRLSFMEYLIGMLITILFYKWTDTTFAFWISVGTLTFFAFAQFFLVKGYITYTFRHLFCTVPWLAAIFSIWAQYSYNPNIGVWTKIDGIVHGRLRLGNEAISSYGFSLFEKNIAWIGFSYNDMNPKGYNYVDCSYLQIALQQGICKRQ